MNKQEWGRLYDVIDQSYTDFYNAYQKYRNGKNQKIRSEGERQVDNAIRLACSHIERAPKAFKLLTGEGNVSDFHRTIIYDEFTHPRYFHRDMPEFLERIKRKIEKHF